MNISSNSINNVVAKANFVLSDEQKKALEDLKNDEKNNELLRKQDMGKDQFMNILITQMTHQNPLEPLQDKDFIAQLAQFSALEQSKKSTDALSSVLKELTSIKELIDKNSSTTSLEKVISNLDDTLKEIKNVELKEIKEALQAIKSKGIYK